MTLTLMPVFFDHAEAATFTALVSAGPELPTSMVSLVRVLLRGRAEGGAGRNRAGADDDQREREPPAISGLPVELHVNPSLMDR